MKFNGQVIKGLQVGEKFGIATANIKLGSELDLDEGVYLVHVTAADFQADGILHYGHLKTFGRGLTCEVHLLDFDHDIYESELEVEVVKFVRETKEFQNADSLYTQIEDDVIGAEKYFLRKKIRYQWDGLSAEERQTLSDQAVEKVLEYEPFGEGPQDVFVYATQKNCELDFIHQVMKAAPEKRFYFPRVIDDEMIEFFHVEDLDDLEPGPYEIPQPEETSATVVKPDLIFVPALAATLQGDRLGKGGGYYDRWLMSMAGVPTICVLPEFAVLPKIPTQKHDIKVSEVLVI